MAKKKKQKLKFHLMLSNHLMQAKEMGNPKLATSIKNKKTRSAPVNRPEGALKHTELSLPLYLVIFSFDKSLPKEKKNIRYLCIVHSQRYDFSRDAFQRTRQKKKKGKKIKF